MHHAVSLGSSLGRCLHCSRLWGVSASFWSPLVSLALVRSFYRPLAVQGVDVSFVWRTLLLCIRTFSSLVYSDPLRSGWALAERLRALRPPWQSPLPTPVATFTSLNVAAASVSLHIAWFQCVGSLAAWGRRSALAAWQCHEFRAYLRSLLIGLSTRLHPLEWHRLSPLAIPLTRAALLLPVALKLACFIFSPFAATL